jgi:hypothetical protein
MQVAPSLLSVIAAESDHVLTEISGRPVYDAYQDLLNTAHSLALDKIASVLALHIAVGLMYRDRDCSRLGPAPPQSVKRLNLSSVWPYVVKYLESRDLPIPDMRAITRTIEGERALALLPDQDRPAARDVIQTDSAIFYGPLGVSEDNLNPAIPINRGAFLGHDPVDRPRADLGPLLADTVTSFNEQDIETLNIAHGIMERFENQVVDVGGCLASPFDAPAAGGMLGPILAYTLNQYLTALQEYPALSWGAYTVDDPRLGIEDDVTVHMPTPVWVAYRLLAYDVPQYLTETRLQLDANVLIDLPYYLNPRIMNQVTRFTNSLAIERVRAKGYTTLDLNGPTIPLVLLPDIPLRHHHILRESEVPMHITVALRSTDRFPLPRPWVPKPELITQGGIAYRTLSQVEIAAARELSILDGSNVSVTVASDPSFDIDLSIDGQPVEAKYGEWYHPPGPINTSGDLPTFLGPNERYLGDDPNPQHPFAPQGQRPVRFGVSLGETVLDDVQYRPTIVTISDGTRLRPFPFQLYLGICANLVFGRPLNIITMENQRSLLVEIEGVCAITTRFLNANNVPILIRPVQLSTFFEDVKDAPGVISAMSVEGKHFGKTPEGLRLVNSAPYTVALSGVNAVDLDATPLQKCPRTHTRLVLPEPTPFDRANGSGPRPYVSHEFSLRRAIVNLVSAKSAAVIAKNDNVLAELQGAAEAVPQSSKGEVSSVPDPAPAKAESDDDDK